MEKDKLEVRKSLYCTKEIADRVQQFADTYRISFNGACMILLKERLDEMDAASLAISEDGLKKMFSQLEDLKDWASKLPKNDGVSP